ncbi:hypothetical protein N7516_008966 [Penicillium verrucosum]|uniref:uncharacterized protein n=1 Tax=Penicillium verrucosum TaxID=60171 RepID=UPI0025457E55|nr:uncharacterized protein N7516_008966 [Penicillium verrucosum]KAJ5927193.1 hypothetical protein N7516_008966 [Penicillium verrucosum]
MPSKQVASRPLSKVHSQDRIAPSFLSPLPDFFFPSLSTHSSPFSKFSHTRGIRSLHIHLKTAVFYSIDLLRQARDCP